MIRKYVTAGLMGTALLATAAFAQTPTATTDRANMAPAAGERLLVVPGQLACIEAGRPQRL